MTNPVGRPTKYTEDMCDKVVELMSQGASKCEVGLELGITEDTFYRWIKEHKLFSEAVKKGEWFSKGAWEKMGRLSLRDKDFNYTGWYMNMKNRHGYSDKQETTHGGEVGFRDNTSKAKETLSE